MGYDARPDTARERARGIKEPSDGIGVEGMEDVYKRQASISPDASLNRSVSQPMPATR